MPERFGDFRVITTRHMRWSRKGVWERILNALAADADNEYAMIPSRDIPSQIPCLAVDKAYDAAKRVLDLLDQHDVEAIITRRANRKQQRTYDEEIYKWRHLIENMFQN